MIKSSVANIILMMAFFSCCSLMAAENLSLKGTLIESALCSVNNDDRIEIDFGTNLGIDKIDGVNYRQLINYNVVCGVGSKIADVYLMISGNPLTGDDTSIQTDKQGLGVRILKDGLALKLSVPFMIDPVNIPVLEAVPVAADGFKLTEGEFQATASIIAEYR